MFIKYSFGIPSDHDKRSSLTSFRIMIKKERLMWAVVVTHLVERSLPIPEVCGSNPVIGKIYNMNVFTVNRIETMIIKKKRPGMAH